MTEDLRNKVMTALEHNFTSEQLKIIDLALAKALRGFRLEKEETLPACAEYQRPIEVKEFIGRKKVKGCSRGTINQYSMLLDDFAAWAQKRLDQIKDIDILVYLDHIQSVRKVSNRTLEGKRLILSSFFSYMHDTGKIAVNPLKGVEPIKYKETIRKPLNDMEMEGMREACVTKREKALLEVLYSTGARISEIIKLNRTDINRMTRRTIITGKGNKERYVFFNARALTAIENYLKTRKDDNEALFVSSISPHNRLGKTSLENIIKKLGERAGIDRPVFPHLLRHTFATDLLTNGTQLDQVSQMLGHKQIDTTKIYAKTSVEMMQMAHRTCVA